MKKLVDSEGILPSEGMASSHRMAYVPFFPDWTWEPLADKYGLDSVYVYPFYCQDTYYKQGFPFENVYINRLFGSDNIFEKIKYVRIIVRIENEELQEFSKQIVFTIDYTRPRKWYKSWLDKWRNYQYDRTVVIKIDRPDVCVEGYCYYVIWFKRENAKNLKSVKYTIE